MAASPSFMQSMLGGAGSLGSLLSGFLQQQQSGGAANAAAGMAQNSLLQPFNFNNNGFAVAGNAHGGSVTGPVSSTGLANLANLGTNAATGYMTNGLPANIASAYGQYGSNFGSANSALSQILGNSLRGQMTAGGLLGAGMNQLGSGLIPQAQGAASNLINTAGADFNSVYNTQYGNLMRQLQLPQQLQMNANQQGQFSRGQLGTTGGALQTQAMATGFGQADLAAAQQAYQQALTAQNSATQNAGILGTLASNQQLTGTQMLGAGFNGLQSTGYLGNNTAQGLFGIGQGNLNTQGQYSMLPAALAGGTLNALTTPALGGLNTLNQMGATNYSLGLNTGVDSGMMANNAAKTLGTLSNQPNFGAGGWSGALGPNGIGGLLSGLGGGTGALGSIGSGIGNLLNGMPWGGFSPNLDTSGAMSSLFGGSGSSDIGSMLASTDSSNFGDVLSGFL